MDVAPTSAQHAHLVRQFSDLRSSLERHDSNLTGWERHGQTYPAYQMYTEFDALARRFDDARSELARVRPEAQSLHGLMQSDTLHIAHLAGQIHSMGQNQTVFGHGWSTTLDQPIRDTIRAIDLLLVAPPAAAA